MDREEHRQRTLDALAASQARAGTEWPKAEAHITDICKVYEETIRDLGFTGHIAKSLRGTIVAGARTWYETYGSDLDRLRWALKVAWEGGTLIKSPGSVVTHAMQYKGAGGGGPPTIIGEEKWYG